MYLLKIILLCFGGAFIGASLFQLRFEKSIAILFMSVMIILYQAYIFDIVSICSIGIVAGIGVGGGWVYYSCPKKGMEKCLEKGFLPNIN